MTYHFEPIFKYIKKYQFDNEYLKYSSSYRMIFFRFLTNTQNVCEQIKEIIDKSINSPNTDEDIANDTSNICYILINFIKNSLDECDSDIRGQERYRHLLILGNIFNKDGSIMKFTINQRRKNSVVAEVHVLLNQMNSSLNFDQYSKTPKIRCNIFLLEDRIIFSRYSKRYACLYSLCLYYLNIFIYSIFSEKTNNHYIFIAIFPIYK